MKLFKMEVKGKKKKRRVLDVIAHADTKETATAIVAGKYTGCEIRNCIELPDVPKYFVIAEWDLD